MLDLESQTSCKIFYSQRSQSVSQMKKVVKFGYYIREWGMYLLQTEKGKVVITTLDLTPGWGHRLERTTGGGGQHVLGPIFQAFCPLLVSFFNFFFSVQCLIFKVLSIPCRTFVHLSALGLLK